MVLSIKNERADELARQLAALTGESITDTVISSLEARLEAERSRRQRRGLSDIVERFAKLPVLDEQAPGELLGYDEHGLPA